jgi:hydroxymethylglutaryl-CoA lyase
LNQMGATTQINTQALLNLRLNLAQWLPGEPLHGALWRAGLPS